MLLWRTSASATRLLQPALCLPIQYSSGSGHTSSHYEVLGVYRSATAGEIKQAFRERAKALHPDLQSHLGPTDAEAFLRLVAAYECLSDAQQRQVYDAATDPSLPGVLRKAAEASAGADDTSAAGSAHTASTDGDAAPLNWRWGLADWARHGPGGPVAAVSAGSRASDTADVQLSVLSALRRHQHELEVELHSALMTAFLGPRVQLVSGELPPACELDERSHPSLTDDLLHLVHGRTLLGVVQLPTTLRLAGQGAAVHQVAHGSSSNRMHLLPGAASADTSQVSSITQHQGFDEFDNTNNTASNVQHRQQQQQEQHGSGMGGPTASPGCTSGKSDKCDQPAAEGAAAADPDAEVGEQQWMQMLQKQHPLFGVYQWRKTPAAASDTSTAATPTAGGPDQAAPVDKAVPTGTASHTADGSNDPDGWSQHQPDGSSSSSHAADMSQQGLCQAVPDAAAQAALGGRAAREAWDRSNEALQGVCADQLLPGAVGVEQGGGHAAGWDATQAGQLYGTAGFREQQQVAAAAPVHQEHQPQEQQEPTWQQQWHKLSVQGQVDMQRQWHQQWHQERKQQQQQGQQQQQRTTSRSPPRSGHRRLWRWLRSPTADWQAADWSFSDESEGVLVLRLVQDGSVSAVAVRDDTQANKPIKVYLDGVLFAAVLDDVVMQPLTGKLMAVLYRYYTTGVHHVYFYLPNLPGGSRVLARLQRRWMPPSSTWLFPPRATSHDRASWVLEWEGFGAQDRPGWLHPAVYVLTAACYSYDMECRRLNNSATSRMQEWFRGAQGRAEQALDAVWSVLRGIAYRF